MITADPSMPFVWRDGERVIRFGRGVGARVLETIDGPYSLLTTERGAATSPDLVAGAEEIHLVPRGQVDALAGSLRTAVRGGVLVALGGGRIIDVAKALAAAAAPRRVVAIPTTLSGAEMTAIHRMARGTPAGRARVRPAVVIADPELMCSGPPAALAASAMNALGHAIEAPLTRRANPVATMAAHEAVRLLVRGMSGGTRDIDALALAAVLAGYAIGGAGYGLHHVLSQTLARDADVGHGPANACMLPHSLGALEQRSGAPVGPPEISVDQLRAVATDAAGRAGAVRLRDLGVGERQLGELAQRAAQRVELEETAPRADAAELLAIYTAAW